MIAFINYSAQKMKCQIELAEDCIDSCKFRSALAIYNQLVELYGPHVYLLQRIAFCYRMVKDLDQAIENYSKALEEGSDDCVVYWSRGACYYDRAFLNGTTEIERAENLQKANENYRHAIELEPTSQEAWLALLEVDLWSFDFDNAISHYGQCKPLIITKEYCLIRSWYGCIALTLAGDRIENEDEILLFDMTIRLKWFHWTVFSMDLFIAELEKMNLDQKKIQLVKEIHERLLMHFDDEPYNPNP